METMIDNIFDYSKESSPPCLIASLIQRNRHNLFFDNASTHIIKKHHIDNSLEYDDISYTRSGLRQRFYYNVPSFPSWGTFQNRKKIDESFCSYRDSLKKNVINFLCESMPFFSIEESFLNNVVLHELLNNAIQSSYAIEKRLDVENGKCHPDEYYGKKNYGALLEIAVNQWLEKDTALKYDILKVRNYAPYSKFHNDRILEKIQAETTNENFFKFCEGSINSTVYTGLSNVGLFMIKKVMNKQLSKLCNREIFFTFEYVHIKNFKEIGAYEFTLLFPDNLTIHDSGAIINT